MSRSINHLNSVVLFSGGMDSTVSLYYRLDRARREGGLVNILTFSYGQRHSNEVAYARMIVDRIQADDDYAHILGQFWVHKLLLAEMPGSLLGGEPVVKYLTLEHAQAAGERDNAFIPYRNLLFLTVAAQYAYRTGSGVITTGLRGGFPDCTVEFERAVQVMLHLSVPDFRVQIDTPTHRSREDTLKLAQTLPGCMGAMRYTLTCFEGTTPPCGHCLPCLKRAEGWRSIGIEDPITGPRYSALAPRDV
jgi:7-cyano-7-deazaguanine synthase